MELSIENLVARPRPKWMRVPFCAAEARLNVSAAVRKRMRMMPSLRIWSSIVSDVCLLAKDKDIPGVTTKRKWAPLLAASVVYGALMP